MRAGIWRSAVGLADSIHPTVSTRPDGFRSGTLPARRDPAKFQHVPIPPAADDVLQAGPQRRPRLGTDGPVERAPVVQWIGQHADASHAGPLAQYHQRQDPDRLPLLQDDQHPQPLAGAEVAPIDLQPIQRLKERRPGRPVEQIAPHRPPLVEPLRIVDLVNVGHPGGSASIFKHSFLYCGGTAGLIGLIGGATMTAILDIPEVAGLDARRAAGAHSARSWMCR